MSLFCWAHNKLVEHMRSVGTLGHGPFFDPNFLPVTQELRFKFPQIQAEILQILKRREELPSIQSILPEQSGLTTDEKWKVFFFKVYGRVSERNMLEAPITASIMSRRKEVVTSLVSVLGPHKVLPPHTGPTGMVLRLHLGIDVPPGDLCRLTVGGIEYRWRNGAFVLFDDTYEHMAVNESDLPRTVLFMDILRPMPPFWTLVARAMLWAFSLTSFFKSRLHRHQAWERNFYTD